MAPGAEYIRQDLSGFLTDQRGVSAIEFTIISAILLPILLIATDIGFAVHQRMIMDSILRSGMQEAMRFRPSLTPDVRREQISWALREAAGAMSTNRMTQLELVVSGPLCHCPQAVSLPVSCESDCAGSEPQQAFALTARLPYRSLFVGDLAGLQPVTLQSRAWVQVYSQDQP